MLTELIQLIKDLNQICDGHPNVEAVVGKDSVRFRFEYYIKDGENLNSTVTMSKSEIKYALPNDVLYYLVYQASVERQKYFDNKENKK